MKILLLLFMAGLPLIVLPDAAFAQDTTPHAATSSVTAAQSEELVGKLRSPSSEPSPAGIYSAGRWRTGLSMGMANAHGITYTTVGAGAGYHPIDGLEVGANVRGWLSSAPSILEITPQVRYVAWQLPRFKPYAGLFYRWNHSAEVEVFNSYGGRLGVLYQSNPWLYLGAGAVWEQAEDGGAAGLSPRSIVYPEFVVSAGPVVVSASRAPRF